MDKHSRHTRAFLRNTLLAGYSINGPLARFFIGGYKRWQRSTDQKTQPVDHIYETFIVRVHYEKQTFIISPRRLGFVLPGNYPDYRGNYPYSPVLGRYHQNNGNAVTLSARWVTSCIRGNYPWPKTKYVTIDGKWQRISLLLSTSRSFGKETIPIDVHTTSIDDCHLYSSMMMVSSPPGLQVRLSAVVRLFVHMKCHVSCRCAVDETSWCCLLAVQQR